MANQPADGVVLKGLRPRPYTVRAEAADLVIG